MNARVDHSYRDPRALLDLIHSFIAHYNIAAPSLSFISSRLIVSSLTTSPTPNAASLSPNTPTREPPPVASSDASPRARPFHRTAPPRRTAPTVVAFVVSRSSLLLSPTPVARARTRPTPIPAMRPTTRTRTRRTRNTRPRARESPTPPPRHRRRRNRHRASSSSFSSRRPRAPPSRRRRRRKNKRRKDARRRPSSVVRHRRPTRVDDCRSRDRVVRRFASEQPTTLPDSPPRGTRRSIHSRTFSPSRRDGWMPRAHPSASLRRPASDDGPIPNSYASTHKMQIFVKTCA